jgi:hypothetical protein
LAGRKPPVYKQFTEFVRRLFPPSATKKLRPDKPSGAASLRGGAQTPGKKVRWCFGSSARVVHNAGMLPAYDFKLALTRVIEPSNYPPAEPGAL